MATNYSKWANFEKELEPDPEDIAREKLRRQKENMSDKEVRRLHDCWEEPEFRRMFEEYQEEVTDPKHRAETEEYLMQCEAEQRAGKQSAPSGLSVEEMGPDGGPVGGMPPEGAGGVMAPEGPAGQELLKPLKGFVLKTWERTPGKKDFDREKGKVFINVCSHEDIEPPSCTDVKDPATGRMGQSWSMPHLVSPALRDEKDKAGHVCKVVDIVFHTEVLLRACVEGERGERWKGMVGDSALSMVAKLHKLDLDPKATHLKIKYYGELKKEDGTGHGPATMSWKPKAAFAEYSQPPSKGAAAAAAAAPAKPPPPAKAAPPVKVASPAVHAAAAATAATAAAAAPPVPPVASTRNAAKKPPQPQPTREATAAEKARAPDLYATREPKHTIVHRGVGGDLTGAWGDTKIATTSNTRPREIVVRVELPELSSAAGVDLDITERLLCLAAPKASYALKLPLPYEVLSEHGSAKFDKASRTLVVTLPVAAEKLAPPPQWQPTRSTGQSPEDLAMELKEAERAEAALKEQREAEAAAEAEVAAARRAEWEAADKVKAEGREALKAKATREEAKRQRALAATAAATEAAAAAHKLNGPPPPTAALAASAASAPAPAPAPYEWTRQADGAVNNLRESAPAPAPVAAPPAGSFEACAAFAGPRPGFAFKRGAHGVGYYEDAASAPKATGQSMSQGQSSRRSSSSVISSSEVSEISAEGVAALSLEPGSAPDKAAAGGSGESSPSSEWVVVEKEAAASEDGESGAPSATGALPKGAPKFSNELLFELD